MMRIKKSEIKKILSNPDLGEELTRFSETNPINIPKLYKIAIDLMSLSHDNPEYVFSDNETALLSLFTRAAIGDKRFISAMEQSSILTAQQQVDGIPFNPFPGIISLMNIGKDRQTIESALSKIEQINDNVPDIQFDDNEIYALAQFYQPIEIFQPRVTVKPIEVIDIEIFHNPVNPFNHILESAYANLQQAVKTVALATAKDYYTKEHYTPEEIEKIHHYAKIVQSLPDITASGGILTILDNALKKQAIEQRFVDLVKTCGMSEKDGEFILLLNKDPRDEKDTEILKKYCEKNIGNMKLNDSLRNLVDELKSLAQSDNLKPLASSLLTHIADLRRFTYKSRYHSKELERKLDKLLNEDNSLKYEVPESNRLTLREAAIMSEIADTNEIINKWFNPTDEKPKFAAFCEKAEQFREQIEDIRVDHHKIKSRHTLFAFHNLKQEKQVFEEESRFQRLFDRCMRLITPYGHTATVHLKEDKLTMNHLTGDFNADDDMTYGDFLYNDIYRFDVSKLVNDNDILNMKRLLGENWQRELNKLYSETERKVHDESITTGLTAAVGNKAYLKIGAKKIFLPKINHYGKSQDLDDKVKAAWSKRDADNDIPMLCSQYTAYTTMMAIENLNQVLRELAADQGLRKVPTVKSPISSKENMKNMHPGQFFKVLNKQGCLIRISEKQVKKYIDK